MLLMERVAAEQAEPTLRQGLLQHKRFKYALGTGDMAQQVQCSQCKPEDPSSAPGSHIDMEGEN